MNHYRFSIGNSNTDGIGICFTVEAENETEAVATAQTTVDRWIACMEVGYQDGVTDVCVYVGPDLIVTADDIDDISAV